MIGVSLDNYRPSLNYYAHGDLGNLLGKLARRIGLIYGMNGLYFEKRFDDNYVKKIYVSKDYQYILNLLGYTEMPPYQFNTIEEMFDYVMTSKYSVVLYSLVDTNAKHNSRDLVRPNFQAFLEYLRLMATDKFGHRMPDMRVEQFNVDNELTVNKEFSCRFEVEVAQYEVYQRIKDAVKFDLVKEHLPENIDNKTVGVIISQLKNRYDVLELETNLQQCVANCYLHLKEIEL